MSSRMLKLLLNVCVTCMFLFMRRRALMMISSGCMRGCRLIPLVTVAIFGRIRKDWDRLVIMTLTLRLLMVVRRVLARRVTSMLRLRVNSLPCLVDSLSCEFEDRVAVDDTDPDESKKCYGVTSFTIVVEHDVAEVVPKSQVPRSCYHRLAVDYTLS